MKKLKQVPTFDYHLDPVEQTSVEMLVPSHQAKIHIAIRADLEISGSSYSQGAVCLSEHMIICAKKRFFGKKFSQICQIHLYEMTKMATKTDYCFYIYTESLKIRIYTKEAMRLARNILRDYVLMTTFMPPSLRIAFKSHNTSHFPPFRPTLSPSQSFQFTYNSFCSYYDSTYYHEIVQAYHRNLSIGQGIFDFNQLPISLIECNYKTSMNLKPFFMSLRYCPFTIGICCSNISRPDFLTNIAPFIKTTKNLRILSLENLMICTGTKEIANSIQHNKNIKISYWDLSGNRFEDAGPLMASFYQYPHPIFYLNFSRCRLSKDAVMLLMQSLISNQNLWSLSYLHLGTSSFNDDGVLLIIKFIRILCENGYLYLKSLDISEISCNIEPIIECLVSYPQPIECLNLAKNQLKKSSVITLISFIHHSETLKELDISGTGISYENLDLILNAISNNTNLKSFSLWIGDLDIHGQKLTELLQILRTNPKKWKMLSLDSNPLDLEDITRLTRQITELTELSTLRLSNIFTHKQKGIGDALANLIKVNHLRSLAIQGPKSNGLENEIIPLFEELPRNTNIQNLDIRNNYFKDEAMNILGMSIRENKSLQVLQIDGARPHNIMSILDFLDIVTNSSSLLLFPLPQDDLYKSLIKYNTAERTRFDSIVREKQYKSYFRLLKNQISKGITSSLSFKSNPMLEKITLELTFQINEALQNLPLHLHSGIGSLIGLQLPFKDPNDSYSVGTSATITTSYSDLYELKDTSIEITEQVDKDIENLSTMQYNSLCIKRSSNRNKPSEFENEPSNSSDYSEDEPEQSDPSSEFIIRQSVRRPSLHIPRAGTRPDLPYDNE